LEHVIEKAGLTKNDVIITGYVPDDELIAMYNLCELFIFPSLHEGFGLPVLEAMSCGAPVIGSNTTSIPEVIGREDALFDPYSVDSIANKIKEVLTDENFRNELREYAIKRSKEFSWDKSAKIALEAFEDIKPSNYRVIYNITTEDDLVEKISHYKESEKELAYIAQMISLNIKSTSNLKQFFVDVSAISRTDLKTGIQRVVRAQLIELLKNPPKGYRVEPIYLTDEGGYWHYNMQENLQQTYLG
jgi:Glycosyltransferase